MPANKRLDPTGGPADRVRRPTLNRLPRRIIILEKSYQQTAALPFRRTEAGIQILLITSIRKGNWIIPKGILDKGLSFSETASEEAFEEAGVIGKIWRNDIGEFQYKKRSALCRVTVFPLEVSEVLKKWPEDSLRERKWVDVSKASKLVREKELGKIISEFPKVLKKKMSLKKKNLRSNKSIEPSGRT